ncbi:GNAT family N-acetyltransferase [Cytobacillus sp. Sa5YUA1]|uniref:GNAT family N-acetyltransferase n=2 Tax=Cytobacillus stercorigallinarum TaxID=2762240 RepID=A0ABR8QPQ9_9BACI|nr:GNAT family N-acetyltransferase [Cytobacillus stercorigallinarum]
MKENAVVHYKSATVENYPVVRELFTEYADSLGIDLNFQDFEGELASLPGKYGSPDGSILLAIVDGKVAGCIAYRKLADKVCEMKRPYVRKAYRNLGIGKELVLRLIEEAKGIPYESMRLDTLATMKSAQKLYRAIGFYEIPPYTYNPVAGTLYMELKL